MKRHLYLLIATLAITLLSADAMAQKKKIRRYFHPEYDFGYLYYVKGEIDSMRVTYSNINKPEANYSFLMVEDKENRILKLTSTSLNNSQEVFETTYTSSNGRDYDIQEHASIINGAKNITSTRKVVDIDDTRSKIIKTTNGVTETSEIEYRKNYSKQSIPIYSRNKKIGTEHIVNVFDNDGYLISYNSFYGVEGGKIITNQHTFVNQYFEFDKRKGLLSRVEFRSDSSEDISSKNTYDKKGNWILQIETNPKGEAQIQRKIYYKNKATK